MAAITSVFDCHRLEFRYSPPKSHNVDRVIPESGMVENMGVEVEIAAPSITVETLFSLPVSGRHF